MVLTFLKEIAKVNRNLNQKAVISLSVSIKDDLRVKHAFEKFEKGKNKNTDFVINEESLLHLPEFLSNFFRKDFCKLMKPVLNYKIRINWGEKINTLDILEALPENDPQFLDRFLRLSVDLVNEKNGLGACRQNPYIILNNLVQQNCHLNLLCILSDKKRAICKNESSLRNYEWMCLILNHVKNTGKEEPENREGTNWESVGKDNGKDFERRISSKDRFRKETVSKNAENKFGIFVNKSEQNWGSKTSKSNVEKWDKSIIEKLVKTKDISEENFGKTNKIKIEEKEFKIIENLEVEIPISMPGIEVC